MASRNVRHHALQVSSNAQFVRAFPDFVRQLEGYKRNFNRSCRALRRLTRCRQHSAIRCLLRDQNAHKALAYDALRSMDRLEGATPQTVLELADRFNAFAPVTGEPVIWRNVRSARRGRGVLMFGPIRRMHQKAVDTILRNVHPPLESQYLFNGGVPMALRAVEAAISSGETYSCELDFIDFYASVRQDDLAEVMRPLPSCVTSHVIWDECARSDDLMRVRSLRSTPTPEPPSGLLLGSVVSPIVGEVLIARLLEAAQLPGVITYADDLIVFGRDEEEMMTRIHTLQSVLNEPPFVCVSGLRLREGRVRLFDDPRHSMRGVQFLKHEAFGHVSGGTITRFIGWQPSPEKLEEYEIGCAQAVGVPEIEAAINKVSNWRRYYPGWDNGDLKEAEYLALLKARRFSLTNRPEHRASAIAAVCRAFLLHSRDRTFDLGIDHFLPGLRDESEARLADDIMRHLEPLFDDRAAALT